VPLPDWDHLTAYYGSSAFTYDAEHDLYHCPQGLPLRPVRNEMTLEKVEYRADATHCNACPLKSQCTPSSHVRSLHRSYYADYLDQVRSYHPTEAYQKALRKRRVWIEPLFGEAKQWHGLRCFRLRRLWKVNCEALVTATGQNIKRLVQQRGWGYHPIPTGSADKPGPGGILLLIIGLRWMEQAALPLDLRLLPLPPGASTMASWSNYQSASNIEFFNMLGRFRDGLLLTRFVNAFTALVPFHYSYQSQSSTP